MGMMQKLGSAFNRIRHGVARIFSSFVQGGYELLVRSRGSSDFPVTSSTMLTYAPIWYSTNKISGHISQMPRVLKQETRDEEIIEIGRNTSSLTWQGRLSKTLNLDPNGLQTSADLFETVQKDAMIDGNGRAGIVRNERGEATQLIRLAPGTTTCFLSMTVDASTTVSDVSDNGTAWFAADKWHFVTDLGGQTFILHDDDVLHIKGLQHDGITGIPLWDVSRDSVGGGKTAEAHTNRLFSNDAIPGMILTAPPGVLENEGKANEFVDTFIAHHTGAQSGNVALLRHGVTASKLSVDNKASQLNESRMFSRDEAWLWTGDIQFYSGADNVYRNGQELDSAYKQQTLARWKHKWDQECTLKLLTQRQRDLGWYIELDMSAILRGTPEVQASIIQTLRATNTISEEDSRRMLGRSPKRREGENYENPNTSSPFSSPAGESEEDEGEESEVIENVDRRHIGLPAPRERYTGHLERDQWIYEQHASGEHTLEEIIAQMPERSEEWELIGTVRGLRNASHRYADFHDLPRINRNVPAGSPI